MKIKRLHINQLLTVMMLWVFSLAITPWSALHHHAESHVDVVEKHCTHKFHLKTSQENCLICKAHFEKNYTLSEQLEITYLDSSVVKLDLSKDGNFVFNHPPKDSFLISISYIGHQPYFSQPLSYRGEPISLPAIVLTETKTKLQGVTVTARKKLLDVKADRTILNVEGTINSTGSDALELLRKSPGVSVDNDEKLSVNGKNGVQVYVDGKPMP
ncbi:MAG: hypothetical protein EOO89_32680, partial [Pedobacter sp.]